MRKGITKLFDYYTAISSEAKHRERKGGGIKTTRKNRTIKGRRSKILPSKQMLEGLLILLVQVKAGNTFENLLNEIEKLPTHWIGKKFENIIQ